MVVCLRYIFFRLFVCHPATHSPVHSFCFFFRLVYMHHISLVFRFIYPSILLHILFIFSNLCCYCFCYSCYDATFLEHPNIFMPSVGYCCYSCHQVVENASERERERVGKRERTKKSSTEIEGRKTGMHVDTERIRRVYLPATTEDAFVTYNQSFRTCRTFVSLAVSGNVSACTLYITTKLAAINHFLPGHTKIENMHFRYEFNFAIAHKQFQRHQKCTTFRLAVRSTQRKKSNKIRCKTTAVATVVTVAVATAKNKLKTLLFCIAFYFDSFESLALCVALSAPIVSCCTTCLLRPLSFPTSFLVSFFFFLVSFMPRIDNFFFFIHLFLPLFSVESTFFRYFLFFFAYLKSIRKVASVFTSSNM